MKSNLHLEDKSMNYILILVFIIFPSFARAQNIVSENEKREIVESIGKRLQESYLYPETAKKITIEISENLENGVYKSINEPNEFASRLTTDLYAVSKDLHFRVVFDSQWVSETRKASDPNYKRELLGKEIAAAQKENFGFKEAKLLEGNIGYLNLANFQDPEYAAETAAVTMKFLSNSDALIIDLRNNNGGALEMAQFLGSYFFNSEPPQVLFEYYYMENNKRIDRQQLVLPSVPGKRMPATDVYILTDSRTFSAAEWFSYALKNLKRATIIGEKTAGGAHPVDRRIISDRFSIMIPFGKITDPVTKTDFEGVGVKPDIEVSAKDALPTAHLKALEKLAAAPTQGNNNYQWYLPVVKAKLSPIVVAQPILKSYTGTYGSIREVLFENGRLYYQWNKIAKTELIPLAADIFALDGIDNFRFQIITENGKATSLMRINQDGSTVRYRKDN
jgi:hypothetical protein